MRIKTRTLDRKPKRSSARIQPIQESTLDNKMEIFEWEVKTGEALLAEVD